MRTDTAQIISENRTAASSRWLLAPLVAAAATAIAVLAAPLSHASVTDPGCASTGTATVCQQPGNAEFTATTPPVEFHPYGALNGPPVHSHNAPAPDHHD